MRRLGIVSLMVLAAVVASSADAWAVEVSVLPTGSEASPVEFTFKGSGAVTLETVAGKKITCSSVTGKGSITSARSGSGELAFVGCHALLNAKCTGLSDATPGNVTFAIEAHLRALVTPSEGVTLVTLLGHVHVNCAGILFLKLGCYATMDLVTEKGGSSIVEKLVSSIFGEVLQKNGTGKPAMILNEAGTGEEACRLTVQEESKTPEEAGLLGSGTSEKFERGGVAVTLLVHVK